MTVDERATPSGWVPVAFGDVQISVPATWAITLGCPEAKGNVYLGGMPKLFCPNEPDGLNIVVVGTDASSPPAGVAPEVINGITVYRLGPDDSTLLVPSLHASVYATGSSAGQVLRTVTSAPRAIALAPGSPPAVPGSWHRVSFGGLSAAVPRTWGIDRRRDFPFGCVPVDVNLGQTKVILSAGTSASVLACPAESAVAVPTPTDGFVIDPGPFGPIPADASFGSCWEMHRLRLCPTTADGDSVLVLSVHRPGHGPPTAVEIGLAGSGLVARTILDSLRPG